MALIFTSINPAYQKDDGTWLCAGHCGPDLEAICYAEAEQLEQHEGLQEDAEKELQANPGLPLTVFCEQPKCLTALFRAAASEEE